MADAMLTAEGLSPWTQIGHFVELTIFAEVHNGTRIVQEEVFGPIVSVLPFEYVAEDSPSATMSILVSQRASRRIV